MRKTRIVFGGRLRLDQFVQPEACVDAAWWMVVVRRSDIVLDTDNSNASIRALMVTAGLIFAEPLWGRLVLADAGHMA